MTPRRTIATVSLLVMSLALASLAGCEKRIREAAKEPVQQLPASLYDVA